MSLSLPWAKQYIAGQPGLLCETLSQEDKSKRRKSRRKKGLWQSSAWICYPLVSESQVIQEPLSGKESEACENNQAHIQKTVTK